MDLAIDRIGFVVERKNLKGVGMDKQRVLLREIDDNSTFRGHRITCGVVVFTIVSCQHILIDRIRQYHIAIGVVRTVLGIVIDTVTNQRLALVLHHRTAEKFGMLRTGVVIAVLTINLTTARQNTGGTHDMGRRRTGIVI